MQNSSSLRTIGPLPTAYVFTLIQHNLVVAVLFLVNSEHMVHGQTLGRNTISFLEFFPIVLGLSLWCSQLKNKTRCFYNR